MSKKTYYTLYAKNVRGTNFKHCSVNPTLYFKLHIDEQRDASDADYHAYMEKVQDEIYDAISHKFLLSIPTKISNDKKNFLIFKDNIDMPNVKEFCDAIIDEINFFTQTKHTADYCTCTTLLLQMDKAPNPFRASKVGEKLTQTNYIDENKEVLSGAGKEQDYGIITPFDTFIYLKNKKENPVDENEETVAW